MKRIVMVSVIFILLIGGSLMIMRNKKNTEKLSPELQGWLSWHNGLTTEEQESIEYIPSELQNSLGSNSKTQKNTSINMFRNETKEWLKWYGTLSREEQTAISYVPAELQEQLTQTKVHDASTDSNKSQK